MYRTFCLLLAFGLVSSPGFGAVSARRHKRRATVAVPRRTSAVKPAVARRAVVPVSIHAVALVTPPPAVHRYAPEPVIAGGPWTEPTFADSTAGDNVDGEDLTIRRAAVDALGNYNGSVVAVDPATGRVLSMVNQKMALGTGFQPCSTVKISVALAALSEKVVDPASKLRLAGMRMDLTYALAHSNNYFFATLGQKLGYEKFSYYARLFGYGEKAGLNIPGEQPGYFPDAPPRNGGVGMLTSFGEEISQTPLQLAALMSAIANGGTLYYLQYPRDQAEGRRFVPRVKRRLEIEQPDSHDQAGNARGRGVRHRAPRQRRRPHRRQDRHVQRKPHPPGLVRLVQRHGASASWWWWCC